MQTTSEKENLWDAIRESIRGSDRDYTEGPIGRSVLLLAVPMVLETCMESIFAIVDIFFVSHLGAAAMATVGLTESMLTILYALAIGLCVGATATVARRIGEKNPDEAAHTAVQAIALGVTIAAIIGVIGFLYAKDLLILMGASTEMVQVGSTYTSIMFGGNATIILLFLINAIFRGAGDAAIAMRVLWFANAINIVLCPCLVRGLGPFPELGVTGAAIATNTGRGIGVLFQLFQLFRKKGRIRIRRVHLNIDPKIMMTILRLSGTAMFQALIGTTSWVGLVRILSTFGSSAVAGYTLGMRIILFALLPSWGMSNAAATLVGQNLGARKPDRAEESVWMTCRYNFMFLAVSGLLLFVLAELIIGFFTKDPNVATYGILCLRIVSAGFIFYAYGMVLTQAFNGAGDTMTPTLINLGCFWLWEIPLGYFLAIEFGFGPTGVFLAITIAFSTLAVVSAYLFKKGRWKTRQV